MSADLDVVADGDAVHSLLLTPQGKLDVDFRLLRVGDDAWLDCDPGLGAQLAASLQPVQDPGARPTSSTAAASSGCSSSGRCRCRRLDVPDGAARACRPAWGTDLHRPASTRCRPSSASSTPVAFDAWRIEQGIPVQPADIDESTIPQEAFLELDAVSFTKGCFLGQELVCRIDSRGHVNRFLRRFTDIDGDWPVRGAEVVVDGKVVGALTSVAPAELPTGALGYVRREVEPPATVELRWDGGTARASSSSSTDRCGERHHEAGARRCRSVRPARRRPWPARAPARWRARCPVPNVRPGTVRDV